MTIPIYEYSLCVSLALMLFFGAYFLLGKVPPKPVFDNYRRSRAMVGVALLVLAANYIVHLFAQLRFNHPEAAIFMNLSTYFLEAWLFSAALTSLLDKHFLTRKLFIRHLLWWMVFTGVSGAIVWLLPDGIAHTTALLAMAGWFVGYAFTQAKRLFDTYRRAVRAVENYHSDYITVYIRWMSTFTYWAIIFGVGVGLLTFLPEQYVFLWILSAIPFYIYLFCSYMNYLLFCEQIEEILDSELEQEQDIKSTQIKPAAKKEQPAYYAEIGTKLTTWMDAQGFTQSGLTISQLADKLHTNRTYLYDYIRNSYGMSFRVWITNLRIDYAKELLANRNDLTVVEIAEACGYSSSAHFFNLFSEAEHTTPAKWRKAHSQKSA